MLIRVSGLKAFVHSVVAPVLLLSIRHHKRFGIDQSTRQACTRGVRAGDLPSDGLLRHVPAHFDGVAGFQNILCETGSFELKNRGTFDCPTMGLSIGALFVQKYELWGLIG